MAVLLRQNGVKHVHAFLSGTVEHEEWDGSHAAVKTHTPLKRVGQPVPKLQRKIDVGFALLLMGSEAQVDLTEAVLCCIRSRPDHHVGKLRRQRRRPTP